MTQEELKLACGDAFNGLKVSLEEAEYLEESTRFQSHSTLWVKHCVGHITASMFHKVV